MSKKLKPNPPEETRDSLDHCKRRSPVEPHHETDEKNVESDEETKTKRYKSDGSEIREQLFPVSSTKEFSGVREYKKPQLSSDSETEEEELRHDSRHSEVDEKNGVIQEAVTDSKWQVDKCRQISKGSDTDESWDLDHFGTCFIGYDMSKVTNALIKDEHNSELLFAAEIGDMEKAKRLLTSSVTVDVDALGSGSETPLHVATRKGHIDIVDLLLSKNANVNSRDLNGWTPLHLAADCNQLEIAQLLLENNADIHETDRSNKTPYDRATYNGHCEIVQLLMSTIKYPSIHSAASCGNAVDVQQILLNSDANPNVRNLDGDTPLHLASENANLEVVEVLLRNNADASIRNTSGKTPLHVATEMGYAEIVKALLDNKDDVNAIDRSGNTALHLAASNGDSAVAKVLLNQSANRDALSCSKLAVNKVNCAELEISKHPIIIAIDVDWTSTQSAAEGGNFEIANIPQSHSSTVNELRKGQATQHVKIQENLTLNGANVNACNNDKVTPLHIASQNGHTSVVEILLDNGAIADVVTQNEKTPFYLSAKNGHADVTHLLLRSGVSDFMLTCHDYSDETPLQIAIEKGHTDVVEVILKHSRKISEKLIKDGKKLNEDTKRCVTPVEFLKSNGRHVSAEIVWTEKYTPLEIRRDSCGYSPLAHAAFSNNPKIVQLLLNVDETLYSELDIADSFGSIARNIMKKSYSTNEFENLSDGNKHRLNIRKALQFLINSNKLNVQDKHFNFILHDVLKPETSANGSFLDETQLLRLQIQIVVIQLLLKQGADFNKKNSAGETPLIIASRNGYCEAIQTLFDWERKSGLKVDIDARDQYGATALMMAVERHHISVMRLLLMQKPSVNLCDNYGCTALHAVFYDPNIRWFDMHILRKEFCSPKFKNEEYLHSEHNDNSTRKEGRHTAIYQLWQILEDDKKIPRIEEEMVKLLLDNDETDVNARDFRGNTPLDLAMKSSKPITSATFEALRNRGAILNLLDLKEEQIIKEEFFFDLEPIENFMNKWIDGPLHLLIFSRVSYDAMEYDKESTAEQRYAERCGPIDVEIIQNQETFRKLALATDDKGRTPLHYVVMASLTALHSSARIRNLHVVNAFLKLGSNINAADIYGKTPLHYAEIDDSYDFLVQRGAREDIKDKNGHTPKQLMLLRYSVIENEDHVIRLPIGDNELLYSSTEFEKVGLLNAKHVAELSKQKLVETIRVCSQSPSPQESSEEAIWKAWIEGDFFRLNARLSQLNTLIHQFFERLADGIKEKDWRFECQPILVGSAEEETKIVLSGDFDFNFRLIKFSQLCDPFPHPLGPKGYFQLKRKPREDAESRGDEQFACFFNSEKCLLTNEVNYRFHITLEEVLGDNNFWQDEHFFQGNLSDRGNNKPSEPLRLCKTVQLRMINPIEDEEGGVLFVNISIDLVACIHVEDYWPEDPLPDGINPAVKTNGCTFVLDMPRFDPSDLRDTNFPFSDTFARISFAPVESRIIKESSSLIKAAYIVCKILCGHSGATYQLKTSLLFCMEALNTNNDSGTGKEVEITQKQLAFWVERIIFCFMEFSRHYVFPLYFMPSFIQKINLEEVASGVILRKIDGEKGRQEIGVSKRCAEVFNIYLDLCPADAAFEIPVYDILEYNKASYNACHLPICESLDREDFIRKLSSRSLD